MIGASTAIARGSVIAPTTGKLEGLRALFVLNSLNVGGSETKTVRLVNGLLHNGIRAGIAYLNGPSELLKALNPEIPTWNLARTGKFSISALNHLRALIQQQRPSCVLSVNLYPALYVALSAVAMRERPTTIALLNTTTFLDGELWRRAFYRPFSKAYGSHRVRLRHPASGMVVLFEWRSDAIDSHLQRRGYRTLRTVA